MEKNVLKKSKEALEYINTQTPTKKKFVEKFSEDILNTILLSHVEENKGKLYLNEAGKSVVK